MIYTLLCPKCGTNWKEYAIKPIFCCPCCKYPIKWEDL